VVPDHQPQDGSAAGGFPGDSQAGSQAANVPQTLFVWTFSALTFAFALTTFLSAVMLIKVGIRCSTALHAQAIHSVLYSPLAFFDVTPSGRILNRFAKDTGKSRVSCDRVQCMGIGLRWDDAVISVCQNRST
jgi:hypothetical protein